MKIGYANSKVERFFTDFTLMKRKLPADWVRAIKKHMDRLEAAETFGDFLALGLGRPEPLTGFPVLTYSLRVSQNVRLIIQPDAVQETILICDFVEVEGVVDYHGTKENWFIS